MTTMSRSFGRSDLANGAHRDVAIWLLACCFMVAVMVLLGGLTRLTHSGLSMVEWEPIVGIVPPLNEADWQLFFAKYKQTPEYLKVNAGMSLADFKGIFWLEYIHRVWGRLIGMVFGLPLLWLAFSGRIGKAMIPRLVGVFLLGAAQGGMGWFMVKSGLVDNPAVSHFRLTAHLALAFLIHAWMFWLALDILADHRPSPRRLHGEAGGTMSWLAGLTILVVITLLFGGLVAGLKAGLIYNTWPLMDGAIVPRDLFPEGFISLFEDIKTVQFGHRTLAEVTIVVALVGWFRARARLGAQTPAAIHAVGIMALVQVGLGIGTLVMVVPVSLASAHQMGAMALLTLCLWAIHDLRRRI
ncbi:COX15/CtaA family protein [Magnetospirillum sp. 15-1]|uniref:COX15/CtaA family protein n=1 Tax=Magnetospirillum sp. 15-1 TaxID=1979370 RepID=UPI000BBC2A7B|nr:COX15/CtaA family protein [Magnetospirillum sp. 15-1]